MNYDPFHCCVFSFDTSPHKKTATGRSKIFEQNVRKKNPSIFLWKFKWFIVASPPPKKRPIFDSLCKTDPFQRSSLSAEQRRSTVSRTGSWRVFWFDIPASSYGNSIG
jgi:hypothetical protein